MKKLTALLVLGLVFGGQSFAQDFPLTAHVKRIEQDKKIRMDDGTGGTQTWHLVIAEIEGHTIRAGSAPTFLPRSGLASCRRLSMQAHQARLRLSL